MIVLDMVAMWGKKLGHFLFDVPVFVVAPRRYLNKVLNDTLVDIYSRLFLYSFVFVIIQVSMFSMVDWITLPNQSRYFETALAEFIVPLLMVPHFYVIARIAGIQSPWVSSIVFISTYRPVMMSVAVIFYSLFLVSENYLFAVVKGILFWLYILGTYLYFPVIVGKSVKMRFALVGVSIALVGFFFLGMQPLAKWLPPSEVNPIRNSVLYDPIGVEYNKVVKVLDRSLSEKLYSQSLNSLVSLYKEPSFKGSSAKADSIFIERFERVREVILRSDSLYIVASDSIKVSMCDFKFESAKTLSRLYLDEIIAGRKAVKAIGSHLDKPDRVMVESC